MRIHHAEGSKQLAWPIHDHRISLQHCFSAAISLPPDSFHPKPVTDQPLVLAKLAVGVLRQVARVLTTRPTSCASSTRRTP
ncbi:uncharacterized protein ACA1_201120 [Acanthamoeba castellanii str. Neff]|uniref:Uncharacterized protein n=1 Tax=Acanthamoeba castellanii (strain ATCC 30010 / Neff) TaxID=1257118 RepID=L8H3H5_ACACF|nr:uncharacterized protein ACA1_201120 [Acanthamoeba castellanii str. Neff]ELR19755.1 hypothetical protein ACA1_201120 [Acanthamoeba castellanii str. Neff]